MGPDEERELIDYLESVIASHPLKRHEPGEAPQAEETVAEPGPAAEPEPTAQPEAASATPEREPAAPPQPPAEPAPGPDLGERGAGLRLLWGVPPAPPAQPAEEAPSPAPEPGRPEPGRPGPATDAQALYDRLDRPGPDAMDQLQAVGISRATVARTGVRWTGETGAYARHLAFPLRLNGVVGQLQFWPLEGKGQPVDNLSLTADEFGPPEGLFGVLPAPGENAYLTETPLDALSLNEQGFAAVAAFQGLPPTAASAAGLRGRAVYLVSADDTTGEAWRDAWHLRLREQDLRWVDVVLPIDVDGVSIQGAHDLLRALPLGFAFADAMRALVAGAEAAAQTGVEALKAEAAAEEPLAEVRPLPPAEERPSPTEPVSTEGGSVEWALEPQAAESPRAESPAPLDVAAPAEPRPAETLVGAETEPGEGGHSSFYLSFLEEQEAVPDQLAPTGLAELNERLAGGFDRGLYVLAGEQGTGKTAFLEDLAIDAATGGRPVLYYALKEGSRSTWERMIARLSRIMGDRPLSLPDLRSAGLDPEGLATLAELDRIFEVAVLPRLTLMDTVPGGPDPLISFLSDLRRRVADRSCVFRRTPLVLIDDLQYLLLTLNAQDRSRAAHVILGVNELLSASRSPAVLTSAWPSGWGGAGAEEPAEIQPDHLAEGLLVLRFPERRSDQSTARLTLEIVKNGRTGWLGELDLVLDRSSGLFWSARDGGGGQEPAPPSDNTRGKSV